MDQPTQGMAFAYSSYQNPWSKTNWWKTNEWTILTPPWSSVQSTKMSPSFLASRDKLGQLKKKPSFPISTNRDETLKRMVITTLPIMMIISSFNQSHSLYRSLAVGDFYGTGIKIWAGFGQVGITEKIIFGRLWATFETGFFMFSWAKKN